MRISVDDLVLDALDLGPPDGEPVLLLHGFPQTSHCWRGVIPTLVAAGLRVVAPDLRGYSPDARPSGAEAYRMPHLVGDATTVLDALGGSAHVVGHDWGAAVAWQLAARFPERVRSLTAVSVPHPLAFVAALRTDPDQRERSLYMRDFAAAGYEDRLLADGAAGLRALFADAGGAVDVAHVLSVVGDPVVLRHCLDFYAAASLEDMAGLGAVTVPTLHVWSDQDRALGSVGARGTADHVTGPYRFEVLPGISHWIPEQAPERLAQLVLEQVRSVATLPSCP